MYNGEKSQAPRSAHVPHIGLGPESGSAHHKLSKLLSPYVQM